MIRKVRVNNKLIGEGESTFIIAEMGANHNNDMIIAKEMIDVASDAGVDAIKFQVYSADSLVLKSSKAHNILKNIEMDRDWLDELFRYTEEKNLIPFASPFDYEAIDQLNKLDSDVYKWASPEIHDLPMLKYAAKKGKPIIISTGMANMKEIKDAVDAMYEVGNKDIILLHCISLYPTEPKDANLRMMDTMGDTFHVPIGFSDHTLGFTVTLAAVARGASVIEKHYTMDKRLDGPDHHFALEPLELSQMVSSIREVEESLGSTIKRNLNCRSIISRNHISKGTKLKPGMITTKRSSQGIKPKYFDEIVGKVVCEDINPDTAISWNMIHREGKDGK